MARMSDLLALATIRRMLLELDVALGPEERGALVQAAGVVDA